MSAASGSMHEGIDTPVRSIAEVLARFEANRRNLLTWIDGSWLPAWAARLAPAAWPEAASSALARVLGLRLPELEACRASDPALAALATLSVDEVLTVLRVRALWFRRNELRRLIGRDSREHCAQLVGTPHAAGLLRHIQAEPDGPQIEPLRRAGLPALDVLTVTRAAWEGWCLMSRDGALPPEGPVQLVRLALPRELAEPDWLKVCDRSLDGDGSVQTLKLLPYLYPERS